MLRLLLDTHAFLWWDARDSALGTHARAAITDGDNPVFVSAATAWEIATKARSGRLDAAADVAAVIEAHGFGELAIEVKHAVASAELPLHHRDPFDRLLVAQARAESLTLVTSDPQIAKYDVQLLDASA